MATRRESVVLELDDRFTKGMIAAAAATGLLDRELGRLDGSGRKTSTSVSDTDKSVASFTRTTRDATPTIDKLSGRLELMVQGLSAVGPATIPITAVAIPAVTALTTELGFAALGAGTMLLALRGVGDGLKALNKAALEPTATNIAAADLALQKIGPEAGAFVVQLHNMVPLAERLQRTAGIGLFPGLTDSLQILATKAPLAERVLRRIGTELGTLSREGAQSLTSEKWAPFLSMIEHEAPQALGQMAHAAGDVAHGLASILVAFQPMNRDILGGLTNLAETFDRWASGLSSSQGFHAFLAYIQQTGPQVAETLSTIGDLFVDLVRDAAPLGGPTLEVLDDLLKILDMIAASPLGTPIIALVQALSVAKLAMTGFGKATEATFGVGGQMSLKKYGEGLRSNIALWRELNATERSSYLTSGEAAQRAAARSQVLGSLGRGAAALGVVGVISTGVTEKIGATNTAMDAMAGAMVGGAPGAVAGGLIGAMQDYRTATSSAASVTRELDQAMQSSQGNLVAQSQAIDQAQAARDAMLRNHQSLSYDLTHPFESLGGVVSSVLNGQTPDAATNAAIGRQRMQFSQTQTTLGQLGAGLGASFSDSSGRSMVPSLQQLQQVADRVTPAMQRLGYTWADLTKLQKSSADFWWPGHSPYDKAVAQIDRVTVAMDSNKGRTKAVSDALAGLDNQMETTQQKAQSLSDALDALFNPKMTLSATHNAWYEALHGLATQLTNTESIHSAEMAVKSAEISYKSAVKSYGKNSAQASLAAEKLADAHKKLAEAQSGSSKAILGNSDAALKNQDLIRGLTGNLLDYLKAQADAGKPSSVIMDTYRRQRQALIDTATQLGINRHDLIQYLKTLGFTPKAISTQINLNTSQADKTLSWFLRRRVIHVDVRTGHLGNFDTTATGGHVATGYADGGTVRGQRHPYGDKVLIAAAPGEQIISNRYGQADRFRSDVAAGRIPGYADGGMVQHYSRQYQTAMSNAHSAGGGGPQIDYKRLAAALANARPLYGDVYVQDGYNGFKRELEQDRRRQALGGART